jgi:hypothetical protein
MAFRYWKAFRSQFQPGPMATVTDPGFKSRQHHPPSDRTRCLPSPATVQPPPAKETQLLAFTTSTVPLHRRFLPLPSSTVGELLASLTPNWDLHTTGFLLDRFLTGRRPVGINQRTASGERGRSPLVLLALPRGPKGRSWLG